MDRRLYVLNTREKRKAVALIVGSLERNWRVEIKRPQRTLPQNDRLWASLTDVSEQHQHAGVTLEPNDWKLVFLDAYWRFKGEELRLVPNLDGNGFVPLSGRSSSDLTKEEMSELLEMIYSKGAEWGVQFHDGQEPRDAQQAPSVAA
jgi:hypothetical protein